jgi:hypothetical protein
VTKTKYDYSACSSFEKKLDQHFSKYKSNVAKDYVNSYMNFFNKQERRGNHIDSFCSDYMFYKIINDSSYSEHYNPFFKLTKIFGSDITTVVGAFSNGYKMHKSGVTSKIIDNTIAKMKKASKASKKEVSSIPKIMHSIWLTNENNPKDIKNEDIENAIYNKAFFQRNDPSWKYIVWTNNKNLIQKSINKLEEKNIEVRSIYEIQDQLKLFDLIIKLTQSNHFGMASDILRYSILHSQGGVYLDLNFKFLNNIESYLNKYDFLTEYSTNHFFASKPNHVILREALNDISENFADIEQLSDIKHDLTMMMTHVPFVLSIVENSNTETNVDFYHAFYNDFNLPNEGLLGEDNVSSANTWNEV